MTKRWKHSGSRFAGALLSAVAGVCLLAASARATDGTREWSRIWGSAGSSGNDIDYAYGVCSDGTGGVYVAGATQGNFFEEPDNGGYGICLTRWSATGTHVWSRIWGSGSDDYGFAVSAFTNGDVCVAGQATASFDGQPAESDGDIFVTRWTSYGTKLWTRTRGSSAADCGYAVAVDSTGATYVAGSCSNSFDSQAHAGGYDLCLIKWAPDGTWLWTRIWGSTRSDEGNGVAIDASNNVYVAGYTYGSFDGQTNTTVGASDLCVTKWSSDGIKQWTRIWGAASADDTANAVACDPRSGEVYVAGRAQAAFDGQTCEPDGDNCLTKWAPDGTKSWTRIWGWSKYDEARGAAVDYVGRVYVGGMCVRGSNGEDIFLTAFNSGGTNLWDQQWGATNGGYGDGARGVFVDRPGRVYVAGYSGGGSFDDQPKIDSYDLFVSAFKGEELSGRVDYAGEQTGILWVVANAESNDWNPSWVLASFSNGAYVFSELTLGTNYWVLAYIDQNANGMTDVWESCVSYSSNPIFFAQTIANVNMTLEDGDADSDGMPDWYEGWYGLNWTNANDVWLDLDSDGVKNHTEYQLRSRPDKTDSDDDGLEDGMEYYSIGTSLILSDTDSDGMPDGWEVANGLDPKTPDANEDRDLDGVSNLVEYQNSLNSRTADSNGDGTNDYRQIYGKEFTRYYYDKVDRLVGAEYSRSSNGFSIAYTYDGNGNLLRQLYLQRDQNNDGLPDVWQFLNGLSWSNATAASGPSGDPDSDGWSNYQERKGGSDPTDSKEAPDVTGAHSITAAVFDVGFPASNFVMAAGQLDGVGTDEIVIGADGNPGGVTNFLLILSQTLGGWTTQRVEIGAVGITSIAIGQPTNTESDAIYLSTRVSFDGTGTIVQARSAGSGWEQTVIATSTNQAAFVLGVREGAETVVSFAPTNGPDGALYWLSSSGGVWIADVRDTNASHRGLGTLLRSETLAFQDGMRLLDAGGLRVPFEFPTNDLRYCEQDKTWCFKAFDATGQEWSNAVALSEQYDGYLVTITNQTKNLWVSNSFVQSDTAWIGLHYSSGWRWLSGEPYGYENWASGEPDWTLSARMNWNGQWYDGRKSGDSYPPIVEVKSLYWSEPEPPATNQRLWRGFSLASGRLRLQATNTTSVFYSYLDDKNSSGIIDSGDDYVLCEYNGEGTNTVVLTQTNIPISASSSMSSYGLACVNHTNSNAEVLFTSEPDGRVFSWTATNAAGPLSRQLFSEHYAGKAWHQLAGYRGLGYTGNGGEGLAGLMVDPTNPAVCHLIYWEPQNELWTPETVRQTPPVTRIMDNPDSGGGYSKVNVKIWDGEGNAALPALQWSMGDGQWSNATVAVMDNQTYTYGLWIEAMPTGTAHELLWNAGGDLGVGFTNTVWLRARSCDNSAWGGWSEPVRYYVAVSSDSDSDGLPDAWELSCGLDPNDGTGVNGSAGDGDGDGMANMAEYIADTHPTNPASVLEITDIRFEAGGARIDWKGGQQARQYLQARGDLLSTSEVWAAIFTNLPPTALTNSILDMGATNALLFYRIKAERQ